MLKLNSKQLAIFLSVLLVSLSGCGGDLGSDKHVSPPAVVLEIGDCYGGDGFFAGPRTCPIKVKWVNSGKIEFAQTWDNLWVGQTVYRECWSDGCFLNFTDSPRSNYRKAN